MEEKFEPNDTNCRIQMKNHGQLGMWKFKCLTFKQFQRTKFYKRYKNKLFPNGKTFIGDTYEFGDSDMPYTMIVGDKNLNVVTLIHDT